jgi:CBS domain-containing protein
VAAAAHLMHQRGVKRLAVVDDGGRLVGVVSRLDVLASIAGHRAAAATGEHELPAQHQRVRDIMAPDVATVAETAPLLDVLDRLVESPLKRVVVVDAEGRPLGMVADTDLVARVEKEDRPGFLTLLRSRWNQEARQRVQRARGQRAADVMTTPVVAVREDAPVVEALSLTVTRHIKRLPVVDAGGRLVGMVARPALLAAALDLAGREPA